MSPINTKPFDRFRQGIYAQGNYSRRGVAPVLGPATTSSIVENTVFGQPKTFSDGTKFTDVSKFSAIDYITDDSYIYPAIYGNVSLRDPAQSDGAIEPLEIRKVVSFTSTEYPFVARSVKGSLVEGNLDSNMKTELIVSEYEVSSSANKTPFIDSDSQMGSQDSTSVTLPGYVPDDENIISAFNDSSEKTETLGLAPSGEDIKSAILLMTGSATSNYMQNGKKSAGKGFTYTNDSLGTDSIAFGGLRRR